MFPFGVISVGGEVGGEFLMSAQRKLAKLFGANVGSLEFKSSQGLVRLYSSAVLSTIIHRCLTDAAVDLCNNLNALQVGDFLRCVCVCVPAT